MHRALTSEALLSLFRFLFVFALFAVAVAFFSFPTSAQWVNMKVDSSKIFERQQSSN